MAQDTPNLESYLNVPVMHPDGVVHNIGVPAHSDIQDFHAALSDYYHDANPEPTAANAIENQPSFRDAARTAIDQTMSGHVEHGFVVNKSGDSIPAPMGEAHDMQLNVHPSDEATFHAHPNDDRARYTAAGPSPNDINLSKKTGVPFYVATKSGLFMVRPSDGKVIQVFDKADWAKNKK